MIIKVLNTNGAEYSTTFNGTFEEAVREYIGAKTKHGSIDRIYRVIELNVEGIISIDIDYDNKALFVYNKNGEMITFDYELCDNGKATVEAVYLSPTISKVLKSYVSTKS